MLWLEEAMYYQHSFLLIPMDHSQADWYVLQPLQDLLNVIGVSLLFEVR